MRGWSWIFLLLVAGLVVGGCDGTALDDEPLTVGEFVAVVSGAASEELRGEASFVVDSTGAAPVLRLRFKTGEYAMPNRPPDHPKMETGVFVSTAWAGAEETHEMAVSSGQSYILLGSTAPVLRVESGHVTVTDLSDERLGGTFFVRSADDELFGEVEVEGRFVARPVAGAE